jgi:hypothetical protein
MQQPKLISSGSKMRKFNYLALAAGIFALASLFLPWFVGEFNLTTTGTKVEFTAYLYQIIGTVNGTSQTAALSIWFGLTVVAFGVIAAVSAFTGSFIGGKKGKLLIYITGILSILSIVIFFVGLVTSKFIGSNGFVYALSYFSNNLGLTNAQVNSHLDFVFSIGTIGYGAWLALIAGIIAFAAIIMHPTAKGSAAKSTEAPAQ